MKGKLVAKAVADWVAGNENSSMLLLMRYQCSAALSYWSVFGMIPVIEAKCAFDLIYCRSFPKLRYVVAKGNAMTPKDEICVTKDESILHVKPKSNYVFSICISKFLAFFARQLGCVEEFLIICQHDDEWHIENVLKPSSR